MFNPGPFPTKLDLVTGEPRGENYILYRKIKNLNKKKRYIKYYYKKISEMSLKNKKKKQFLESNCGRYSTSSEEMKFSLKQKTKKIPTFAFF